MSNWRTVIHSRDPAYMVAGSELECMKPDGFLSRFMIYSVRCYVANPDWTPCSIAQPRRFADTRYRVRDADRITDADVRAGKRPPIVGEFATLDEALAAIEPHRHVECVD